MGADLFVNAPWQFILKFGLTEVGSLPMSMKKP